jgi:hypothetical protein
MSTTFSPFFSKNHIKETKKKEKLVGMVQHDGVQPYNERVESDSAGEVR